MKNLKSLLDDCAAKGVITESEKNKIIDINNVRIQSSRNLSLIIEMISIVAIVSSYILLLSLNDSWLYVGGASFASLIILEALRKLISPDLIAPFIFQAVICASLTYSLALASNEHSHDTGILMISIGSLCSLIYSHSKTTSNFIQFLFALNILYVFSHLVSILFTNAHQSPLYGVLLASLVVLMFTSVKSFERIHGHLQLLSLCAIIFLSTILIISRVDDNVYALTLWATIAIGGFVLRFTKLNIHKKLTFAIIVWSSIGLIYQLISISIDLNYGKVATISLLACIGIAAIVLHQKRM